MEVKGGLFEILSKIKARPGLYIGRPSLSDLFMFLVGYKTARRELGIMLGLKLSCSIAPMKSRDLSVSFSY